MNALARAIFFGKHGELRERALQDQLGVAPHRYQAKVLHYP